MRNPMKNFAYRTTLSLLAVATTSPALAEDSSDGDDRYSITVIGDRLDADQTNASWSLIDKHDLDRAQNGSAAEQIARLPGVNLSQSGAMGGQTSLRIRGAEGEQTLVVIDGVRVGDPS